MRESDCKSWLLRAVVAELAIGGGLGLAQAQDVPAGLEVITVTAQKRSETLNEVPATISAITEDQLSARGINSTFDLAQSTPGLTFGRTASWTNFYMRGLGNSFNTPAAQSPVAMYVDGVYQADAAAMALGLDNVERVEILKGPQGTLYGRNAVGGAINVITKAPEEGEELKLKASLGNLSNQQFSAYIGGGTETLQANMALDSHERDGYYRNIAPGGKDLNDIDDLAARAKLRFTPSDSIDLTLAVDYSEQAGSGPATQNQPFEPIPWAWAPPGAFPPGLGYVMPTGNLFGGIQPTRPWQTSATADVSGLAIDQGASLTGRFKLGNFDLVSITAYREFENDHGVDFDATNAPVVDWRAHDDHRSVSQEFQLLSPQGERLTWIAGLYYLHDDASFRPFVLNMFTNVDPNGVFIEQNTRVQSDSYAVFAEGTYDVTDAFSVVLGARYSKDELDHYLAKQTVTPAAAPQFAQTVDSSGAEASFDDVTPRISLTYQRPEGLYYLTASQGYAAGLFNISNVAPTRDLDQPVDPQKVDAFEAGAKWQFLDNRVHLNVAGFYYDVQDLQTMQIAGSGLTSFENADAEIQGIDVDMLWAVTPDFTLRAAFEYLDATYSSYRTATVWVPNAYQAAPLPPDGVPPCFDPVNYPAGQPGTTPVDAACVGVVDLTGEPLMRSPEFTSTLGFDWQVPLLPADRGSLTLTGNWYHSDEFWLSTNGTIVSPSYDSFSANIAYRSPGDRWSMELWGNNLSNAEYYLTAAEANYGRIVMLAEPRTYGVTVGYHFGL